MTIRSFHSLITAGVFALLSGCVERRFVIETTPPGAKVYVNNRPIGSTPVDMPFTYSGKYLITLELDGYETRNIDEKVVAKWYYYPPIDFVAENIYPGKISDVRRLHFDMAPLQRANLEELRYQAEEIRDQARNLPPPTNSSGRSPPARMPPPPLAPAPFRDRSAPPPQMEPTP